MSHGRQPALETVGGSVTQNSPFIGQQMSMTPGPGPQQPLAMGTQEVNKTEELSGDPSKGSTGYPRLTQSPVGSAGSRQHTPIPGTQAGSPMPVRPPSGQSDGQSRLTQSPMAASGYNQQIMPPPNNMGYMHPSGKSAGGQPPGHYPQYNSQYPQGNYGRQQPNMGTVGGPPLSGPLPGYPGYQPHMYPNGPSQGPPVYSNMPGMVRSMGQQGYAPSQGPYPQGNTNMGGLVNSHYPGYGSHMPPGHHSMQPASAGGHHGMPQTSEGSSPAPPGSVGAPSMIGPHGNMLQQQQHLSSNKLPQAPPAQPPMHPASNSPGPHMPHNRGSMSPSRGMFVQSAGGPLAHMTNMTNSPNLGSSSLNSISNVVEQISRNALSGIPSPALMNLNSSVSSPMPRSPHIPTSMNNNSINSGIDCGTSQQSPLSNAETNESLSRPGSATDRHSDLPHDSAMNSYNSVSMTSSDSTSVDSGFHSSDQSDKTSDSVSTPTQSNPSPPLSNPPPNGDMSRTMENISPPEYTNHQPPHHLSHHHHLQQQQQHYHMTTEPKMPYNSGGLVGLNSSAMSLMPSSSSSVVTTVNAGPLLTTVTQSIPSPVTSVSTSASPSHMHPHPHMLTHSGPPHNMPHGMVPGPHGIMPNGIPSNGMPPNNMMNAGIMGRQNQMPPEMGGYMYGVGMAPSGIDGPNMNMNQNGPLLGGPMMNHNGPMMPSHPPVNSESNMPPANQIQPQQRMNSKSRKNTDEDPPEKKRKQKKQPGSDLGKLFELGPEPDRRHFLERIFAFLEEGGNPVTVLPVISKTPLDLYKLYFSVREKGGFEEVTKSKKWRDICTVVNIGTSASAAFTLKKNYIRYLLNYECKFDRGGISPAPILAQMEAQLAHKREQKSRRAPSPAGSNSSESFRPPSVPNNQMDSSYQPTNVHPPPYMQNSDGGMSNMHMGGNMMMGPNNMMGVSGPHGGLGGMMAGHGGMVPSGLVGGSGPGIMHGQQGMMVQSSGTGGGVIGSQMQGGPPSYSSMLQQQPPQPGGANSAPPLSTQGSAPSDQTQNHFPEGSNYQQQQQQQQAGQLHPTPPPQSAAMATGYPSIQQNNLGSSTLTNCLNQPVASSAIGSAGQEPANTEFRANNEPVATSSNSSFPTESSSDRFEQLNPNVAARQVSTPNTTPPPPPQPQTHQQPGENSSMNSGPPRFAGPQQMGEVRTPQGGDVAGQYTQSVSPYQGPGAGYQGLQYNYQQNLVGPRPPMGPANIYGTPVKRIPDDATAPSQYHNWSDSVIANQLSYSSATPDQQSSLGNERMHDGGHWSPVQRHRAPQSGMGYMSSVPPSTPVGQFGRLIGHKNSPQSKEHQVLPQVQQKMPSYGGLTTATLARKEISFPADSVESTKMNTTKRKKLTSKDLVPCEPWRLMLALKSGLLAESTWALDTLNILLYDDTSYGYFGLNTLPGLLEVLTEHLRHCLMQMFPEFECLESQSKNQGNHSTKNFTLKLSSSGKPEPPKKDAEEEVTEWPKVYAFSKTNYTTVSRKGLPVKFDQNPKDVSVLDVKNWDVFCNFDSKSDHWTAGHGNMTDHVFTHLESGSSINVLSSRFRRKRAYGDETVSEKESHCRISNENANCMCKCVAALKKYCCHIHKTADVQQETCEKTARLDYKNVELRNCELKGLQLHNSCRDCSNGKCSNICVHGNVGEVKSSTFVDSNTASEPCVTSVDDSKCVVKQENEECSYNEVSEKRRKCMNGKMAAENGTAELNVDLCRKTVVDNCERESVSDAENALESMRYGHLEENTLSTNQNSDESSSCIKSEVSCAGDECKKKFGENCNKDASAMGVELIDNQQVVAGGRSEQQKRNNVLESKQVKATSLCKGNKNIKRNEVLKKKQSDITSDLFDDSVANSSVSTLNDTFVSETEELSASVVSVILKKDEHLEEEALQRDDPPLCILPESRDELGRRCVCISNIFRSLSCVPGNEEHIGRHPGIMRVLSQLLLLYHHHPEKPAPRKLAYNSEEEEEEKDQSPRLFDDAHWWWDYLDQLRENTLVIISNICGHLKLVNFSEQVCFPLLDGLLHWVICPASVARDPLPTLPAGSVLSPQRLVLEALCKLCIHETNVDLLLATPPIKKLLELFSVLVHLLADRNHQITREFSIVLLSFLVSSESSAARAVALQHPSISLLVDFLEAADQAALTIANQQGIEALQVNPEMMGTSMDMLRRAASILLHMARVPDNRKMFLQQQDRLLKLVMSQILDQSVSTILSEVLYECSQST